MDRGGLAPESVPLNHDALLPVGTHVLWVEASVTGARKQGNTYFTEPKPGTQPVGPQKDLSSPVRRCGEQ